MMTPQEAESHVFAKASFSGGYNMAQVDAFLDVLIADYAALYKENATLKSKMKVLVEKIEEYRSTEDAMRQTLLSAQKMADTMIKEAESKKAEAMAQAEAHAKLRMEHIQRELANEELRLTAARSATAAYVGRLKELYTHELEYIGRLSDLTVLPPDGASGESAKEPDQDTISKLMNNPEQDAQPPAADWEDDQEIPPEEEQDAPVAEEPMEEEIPEVSMQDLSDETMVFDRLQFGKDYDFE